MGLILSLDTLRDAQVHEIVGYLGLPGSWTHQVTLDLFGESAHLQGYDAPELLAGYASGEIAWICVPYFSSIAGPTPYLAQLLALHGLWIERDVVRPVQHSLAVREPAQTLSSISHVTGHPVALEEVRSWLEKELPGVGWSLAKSGSDAASVLARSGEISHAAVAPPQAVAAHGLHSLVADIPTVALNVTRWWLLGPKVPQTPSPGRLVWLKVSGPTQQALCSLENALPDKAVEPALWIYAPSDDAVARHWLVACLRSEDLYAFLALVSVNGLCGTLLGVQDEPVSDLISSDPYSVSACFGVDQAQVDQSVAERSALP